MSDDPPSWEEPGEVSEPPEPTDADTRIADAAASALARARAGAAEKGLRPGMKPKRRRRVQGDGASLSGSARDGRDPALLGDQLDRLLVDRGWKVDVAVGSVMGRWPEIVGADIAAHVEPVSFTDGVLTVRADSTAWATQIRLLASSLLARVEEEIGAGAVTELRVVGPSAPSWNRGTRRSPDSRGPRDTYG
ncbi:MAG TPA: DciA family protein [Humibacillus sp.]|nr:DciA family protein [Humibacillus sp.]